MKNGDIYTDEIIEDIRLSDASSGTPSFLCRWQVEERIGHGTYGSVYKISKPAGSVTLRSALKVIPVSDGSYEMFTKEFRILNSLDGINLTEEADFDEVTSPDGERRYILIRMELLNHIDREHMSIDEVLTMGKHICEALTECHTLKPAVIHLDVKPDNIMVSDSKIYKLGDFGASRIADGSPAGRTLGTPYYMPPEIAAGQPFDVRADIYSLAITMYVLLNKGNQPFMESGDKNDSIRRRLSGELLPEIPGCPPRLISILRRGAAKEPQYRFASAREFSDAIDEVIRERTQGAQPQKIPVPQPARSALSDVKSAVTGTVGKAAQSFSSPLMILITGIAGALFSFIALFSQSVFVSFLGAAAAAVSIYWALRDKKGEELGGVTLTGVIFSVFAIGFFLISLLVLC